MRRLTLKEFRNERAAFDEAILRTPETARFTASFVWQMAAAESIQPPRSDDEWLIVEEGGSWIVFAEREGRRVFYPPEAAWMFSPPLVGDPKTCLALLEKAAARWLVPPFGYCFGGVRKDGQLHEALRTRKIAWSRYEEFPATDTMEIDLSQGFDAWLARRSKKFRKSCRQLRRPEGLEIVDASNDDPDESFARILSLQQSSPKAVGDGDIFAAEMFRSFYRRIFDDLHRSGNLRLRFAQVDGADAAYIFGGRFGCDYRGFQMTYAERFRGWGLGNLLQLENLRASAEEGVVVYDLGMHAPYKERWADVRHECVAVFFQP